MVNECQWRGGDSVASSFSFDNKALFLIDVFIIIIDNKIKQTELTHPPSFFTSHSTTHHLQVYGRIQGLKIHGRNSRNRSKIQLQKHHHEHLQDVDRFHASPLALLPPV